MRQGYYFSLFPATTGQAAFACLESCSRLLSSLPVLTTAHPAPATQRAEGALQNWSQIAPRPADHASVPSQRADHRCGATPGATPASARPHRSHPSHPSSSLRTCCHTGLPAFAP